MPQMLSKNLSGYSLTARASGKNVSIPAMQILQNFPSCEPDK